MTIRQIPVLIVGGGPVGLCASLLLARHGIDSLLVERHPGTSIHPRARGLNVRSMELLRTWGIEDAVRAAGREQEDARFIIWATSLAGPEQKRVEMPFHRASMDRAICPTSYVACAQDKLEPVLLAHVRSYAGAQVAFNHELVTFQHDDTGVVATVRERTTGQELTIESHYLIAADGATSGIRAKLGLSLTGEGVLAHWLGAYFQADLGHLVADRPGLLYWIDNPEIRGLFVAVNNRDRWVFQTRYDPARGESAADFTEERCVEIIRRASGVANLEVKLLAALPWTMAAQTSEHFRVGRVLLAGDAAHVIPPVGGQDMNVGIQGIHNLAWKLAGVIRGWAGPDLLDTYEVERRPVAQLHTEEALRNTRRPHQNVNNLGLVLGVSYASRAVISDGTPPPELSDPVADYVPIARPGHRAPHVCLERNGAQISTLDLFDTTFTLLAGPSGSAWCEAARAVARTQAVPLQAYTVGPNADLLDPQGSWSTVYDVEAQGAVLVRPDGHVAWRSAAAASAPQSVLARILHSALAKDGTLLA